MLKAKSEYKKFIFAILGMAYLNAFSNLNINIFLKGYIAIVPIQIIAIIYAIYLIQKKNKRNRI
ncbi:hypothetical protein NIES4102_21810 [Chondrocystis sp. NIES-4102]|nr:hypothetical protein NIES4102_21810 [Chondrocystis sp. NIES-4102]